MLLSIATIAIASTAFAQVSGTVRLSFGTTPRWEAVPGTQVSIVGDANRPDYDVFRYGNSYYVYRNDRWYASRDWRGEFTMVDDSQVPDEFTRVPRTYWRSYPSRWQDQNNSSGNNQDNSYNRDNSNGNNRDNSYNRDNNSSRGGNSYGNDNSTTFSVAFGSRPSWEVVRGTGVRVIRSHDRPSYDMFSYRGNYYVYANGRWYMSRKWRGDFALVETNRIPNEFRRVPRSYWRDYAWSNGYYGGRYEDRHDHHR
jgi:hypothetical protein